MHELSLCQAIAATVERHAEGRTVERVQVRVGHLRQVVPDAMRFSWEVLTSGSDLEGCVLELEHVPAVVVCSACAAETTLDLPIPLCGQCQSGDVELVSGEEFLIASLDVREAAVERHP